MTPREKKATKAVEEYQEAASGVEAAEEELENRRALLREAKSALKKAL